MTDPTVAQTPSTAHEIIEDSGADDLAVAQDADGDHEAPSPRVHGPIGGIPSHHSTQKGPQWSRELAAQRQALLTQATQARAAAAKAAQPPTPKKPSKLTPKQQQIALEIGKLALAGALNKEIATKLKISEGTVRRYRKRPDFDQACERARQALKATSDDAAMVGRSEALEAARVVVRGYRDGVEGIGPREAMQAAALLASASAPPSQTQREAARKDLLSSLSPGLRRQVMAELQAAHAGYLDALSDDELERMLGEA